MRRLLWKLSKFFLFSALYWDSLYVVRIVNVEHADVFHTHISSPGKFSGLVTCNESFWTLYQHFKKNVFLLFGSWVGTEISSCIVSVLSDCYISLPGRPRIDLIVVDLVHFLICFMWPISVVYSTPINLLIVWASIPGHPFRYPVFADSIKVVLGGLNLRGSTLLSALYFHTHRLILRGIQLLKIPHHLMDRTLLVQCLV